MREWVMKGGSVVETEGKGCGGIAHKLAGKRGGFEGASMEVAGIGESCSGYHMSIWVPC